MTNLLLHPLDSVKIRMQADDRGVKQLSFVGMKDFVSVVKKMHAEEGWTSFYRGLSSAMVGAGTAWGMYFMM